MGFRSGRRRGVATRLLGIVMIADLGCAAAAMALEGAVEGRGSWWYPSIGGRVAITRGGQPGSSSRVDVADDLGLGRSSDPSGDVAATIGRHVIGLRYDAIGARGSTTTPVAFVFHGTTYPSGERIDGSVGLDRWTLRYDYALLDGTPFALRAGPRALVWSFDASVRGEGPGGSLFERRHFTHVFPGLGASARQTRGIAFLEERVDAGLLASDRYQLEVEGGAGVVLGPHATVAAGYRWSKLRFHETTNVGDLALSGPALTLELRY